MTNECASEINSVHNKINESELFIKHKSSYKSAFLDLSVHTFLFSSSFYLLWFLRNSLLSFLIVPFMALMLDRTFMIFHDCCHQSYTQNKTVNYILSHITGAFVLTSPNWILDHHTHHLTNGNTENKYKFKFNELINITKEQYNNFSVINKHIYSFIHHPIIFFNFIPFLYFVVLQRFMYIIKKIKYNKKIGSSLSAIFFNHLLNNLLICALCKTLLQYNIFALFFASYHVSSVIGFLLFFNQHTFNPSYVVGDKEWTQRNSGLLGSSLINIPKYLKYFTMGIEYHHIHHTNSKIPGYNLELYHEEVISKSNVFDNIVKLSIIDCYNNLWLVLYDEDKRKYITLKDANEYTNEEIKTNKIN
jgi:omega-6 fatty acid desaturase (delta-12 desaturase)